MRTISDRSLSKELDLVRLIRKNREFNGIIWAMTTRS